MRKGPYSLNPVNIRLVVSKLLVIRHDAKSIRIVCERDLVQWF